MPHGSVPPMCALERAALQRQLGVLAAIDEAVRQASRRLGNIVLLVRWAGVCMCCFVQMRRHTAASACCCLVCRQSRPHMLAADVAPDTLPRSRPPPSPLPGTPPQAGLDGEGVEGLYGSIQWRSQLALTRALRRLGLWPRGPGGRAPSVVDFGAGTGRWAAAGEGEAVTRTKGEGGRRKGRAGHEVHRDGAQGWWCKCYGIGGR